MNVSILLLHLIYRGSALPTPSTDACNTQASTDSDSSTRTTYGIFWSCITTIFACTWVAVHPDIPNKGDSDRKIFWHRMRILVVALIAPEYIITWAASQLHLARKAVKSLCHIHSCRDWTLTHGMFLVMGGFILADVSGKHLETIQDEEQLVSLLEQDIVILPHISSSEIMDRSKSDVLAKVLVLIQTSWFLVQVISRAVLHLPITELELTTVAFALLNFMTYAFWWRKPLDVRYPILIRLQPGAVLPSSSLSQTTLLFFNSKGTSSASSSWDSEVSSDLNLGNSTPFGTSYPSGSSTLDVQLQDYNQSGSIQDKSIDNTDFNEDVNGAEDSLCSPAVDRDAEDAESIDADAIRIFSAKSSLSRIITSLETTIRSSVNTVASESFDNDSCPVICSLTHATSEASNGISQAGTKVYYSAEASIVEEQNITDVEQDITDVEQDITDGRFRSDVTGLKACASGEPSSESPCSHSQPHKTSLSGSGLERAFNKAISMLWYLHQFFRKLAKKFYDPNFDNLSSRKGLSPLCSPVGLEMCIGVLFGSIHCAAWNFRFSSAIEQHLWRIMSLCITGAPLVLLIIKLLVYVFWPSRGEVLGLPSFHLKIRILKNVLLPFLVKTKIVLVAFAIYILARLATFTLAFTLLRDLSPGALKEVQWTAYIPHV